MHHFLGALPQPTACFFRTESENSDRLKMGPCHSVWAKMRPPLSSRRIDVCMCGCTDVVTCAQLYLNWLLVTNNDEQYKTLSVPCVFFYHTPQKPSASFQTQRQHPIYVRSHHAMIRILHMRSRFQVQSYSTTVLQYQVNVLVLYQVRRTPYTPGHGE